MCWEDRCVQGVASGSVTCFVEAFRDDEGNLLCITHVLHRVRGWISVQVQEPHGFHEISQCVCAFLTHCIVHVRMVLVQCTHVVLPSLYPPFWCQTCQIVVEASTCVQFPVTLNEAARPVGRRAD